MVHSSVQSMICLELHSTFPNSSPKDVINIGNETVYGTHLKMLLKMNLRVQMNAKSVQLKNESKIDAHEGANRTTINAFDVCLMMLYRVHLIKHLTLHLKVHFKKIYKEIHLRLH